MSPAWLLVGMGACAIGAVLVSPRNKRWLAAWLVASAQYQENMRAERQRWSEHRAHTAGQMFNYFTEGGR